MGPLTTLILVLIGGPSAVPEGRPGVAPGVPTAASRAAAGVESDHDERTPVAVPRATPTALRYHRSGNALWLAARAWDLVVPLALLVTGGSARLRDFARRLARPWAAGVGLYVVSYMAITYLADWPLRFYAGYVRQRAYGLSVQTFGKWQGDSLKALAVDLIGGFLLGWLPFLVIRRAPRRWWLVGSLLTAPFLAVVALVAPVWFDPMFNRFGPMADPALERQVLRLAADAGVHGVRVFEVDKSVDTTAANAYVTGLFATKRVVLWDTLLEKLDDREVLTVVGHELGHYVLNHVAWGVAVSSLLTAAGLFWADRVGRRLLRRHSARFGFDSLADVAATPLLLLLLGVASTALGPVALAYSRARERDADRFALDLTHMNRSFGRAEADLQRSNLGVPRPAPLYRLWRASHPSTAERIEFGNRYCPWDARP